MAQSLTSTTVESVDDLFEAAGGFGRFQCLMLVVLLFFEIPTAFVVFSPVFTGRSPLEWVCDNRSIERTDPDFCSHVCVSLTAISGSSIVSEWNLVCDMAWVADSITTVQMLGLTLGNFAVGQFADWYGRRWTFLGTIVCLSLGTLLSAVSVNVYMYTASRFLCGIGYSSYVVVAVIYAMEFMTPEWRSVCSAVSPVGEGIMLLGLLGYQFQDSWRKFLLVTAIPYIPIIVIFPFLPESPRWLIQHRRLDEAQDIFNLISRTNKVPQRDPGVLRKVANNGSSAPPGNEKVKRITYIDFFKDRAARKATLLLSAIWISWILIYFGISFNIRNIGDNVYLNVILLGLCDAIGYPCSYFVNRLISRRQALATFMSVCSVFLVSLVIVRAALFLSETSWIILTFCILGKLFAAAARASLRVMTGEAFPTAIRNMGFGIVGVFASLIGGTLAPQLAFLGTSWPAAPFCIFAACSLIGAGLAFLLRETKGQPLTEGMKSKRKVSIHSIATSIRRLSLGAKRLRSNGESPSIDKNVQIAEKHDNE